MAASFVIVMIWILATRSQGFGGEGSDEVLYNEYGENFRQGQFWWASVPFGIEHASAWKAPGYPAWVGFWYSLVGASAFRVYVIQALLAPLTVLLTWALGRRVFTPRVGLVAAWIVAVFPLVFEYYGMLFPEALVIPLTLGVLLVLSHRRAPDWRGAALLGALIGVTLLIRPTSFFLFAPVAVLWMISCGPRRGAGLTAIAIAAAALVIAPWTIRNYEVTDGGFIPLSVQDGAVYGTFNDEAANDPENPYAWRFSLADPPEILTRMPRPDDAELRTGLQDAAFDYIADHPGSVAEAFYWNGIRRFWDLRSPDEVLDEVEFQGRSRAVRGIGLGLYWLLLPLAAYGAWAIRGRRRLLWPLAALVLAASVAFTIIGGTRYRAPLEPLVAIGAAVGLTRLWPEREGRL